MVNNFCKLNEKTWFMRHSNGNDMAKQTCHLRRATQLALLTGGAQDEHPCAAAPWAGARSESAPLRCGSFVESGWLLFWRDRCLDCCRAVMVCLCVPVPSNSPTGRSWLSCGVLWPGRPFHMFSSLRISHGTYTLQPLDWSVCGA